MSLNYFADHSDMDYYAGQLFLAEVHRIRIRGQRHF
jgi:hypothetical protein